MQWRSVMMWLQCSTFGERYVSTPGLHLVRCIEAVLTGAHRNCDLLEVTVTHCHTISLDEHVHTKALLEFAEILLDVL